MSAEPHRPNLAPARLVGTRVLVTEDDRVLNEVLVNALADWGLEVDSVHEREEAQALLAALRYDLLVTDISLSSALTSDGFDVLTAAQHASPPPKTLVLSGHPTETYGAEALRRGAHAFLCKPVSLEQLRETVFSLLHSAEVSATRESGAAEDASK